jgi:PPOX class probable F420-dependent enzyme
VVTSKGAQRRAAIALTEEELRNFLDGRHVMSVATIGADGRPHLTAMWYGFFADGTPGLWTYGKSQKVVNARRDPRVTCLLEDGEAYDELRGAELECTAEVFEEREIVDALGLSVYERYTGPITEGVLGIVQQVGAKRIAMRLNIDKVVSWDHRKQSGPAPLST